MSNNNSNNINSDDSFKDYTSDGSRPVHAEEVVANIQEDIERMKAQDSSKSKYDDSSIRSLKGADRVRMRPEVMLGTSNLAGTRHTVFEILGNGLDEANSGYGRKFEVIYYEDTAISVRDFGRGVPLGWNEAEQRWNWDLIYNELYAGGKYDDSQEKLAQVNWDNLDFDTFIKDFNYLFTVGLNGLGATAVQSTSAYFEVKSYRDGKCSRMYFEHGIPVLDELEITDTDEPNGTFVKWLPDADVLPFTDVGADWLFSTSSDVLNISGLDLYFENKKTGFKKEVIGGGLMAIAKERFERRALKDSEGKIQCFTTDLFTHGTTKDKGKDKIYVCKLDAIVVPVSSGAKSVCYHNSIPTSGGSQHSGISRAISEFFCNKVQGIKLETSDYINRLGVVLSSYSNIKDYKGQTKDELNNDFVELASYKAVMDLLNLEFSKGNRVLLDLIEEVKKEAEARIAIKEYAKQVRQIKKVTKEKAPEKFSTCEAYDNKNSAIAELWITEGDSAKGACKRARDSDFQALFPIRGKILNVLKATMEQILKNKEIRGIFALLETGMDIGEDLFDITKLRFDKIIFATDADEDGFQIRVLLFLVFYKLAPKLLETGHVYVAETPLFRLRLTDGSDVYAFSQREMENLKEEYAGRIQSVNRFKGLGECPADVLRETTMLPETRRLVPLTLNTSDENCQRVIDVLFGADKGKERKGLLTSVLGDSVAEMFEANELQRQALEDMEDGVDYVSA